MSSNIKVAVRVRPLLPTEQSKGMTRSNALEVTDHKSITVVSKNTKHFGFD